MAIEPMSTGGRREEVAGVLLAGGLSRRMGGGDKCLRLLGGQTLLARILARVGPQVKAVMLNANGDGARFAAYGLPVVADSIGEDAGPLAGVLTGMEWAAAELPTCQWLATFPTDAPFLPLDLVARMHAEALAGGVKLARGFSGGRRHPVVGLWHLSLEGSLRQALVEDGVRKVDAWTAGYGIVDVAYPSEPVDPFFNANKPQDLEIASKVLEHLNFDLA